MKQCESEGKRKTCRDHGKVMAGPKAENWKKGRTQFCCCRTGLAAIHRDRAGRAISGDIQVLKIREFQNRGSMGRRIHQQPLADRAASLSKSVPQRERAGSAA